MPLHLWCNEELHALPLSGITLLPRIELLGCANLQNTSCSLLDWLKEMSFGSRTFRTESCCGLKPDIYVEKDKGAGSLFIKFRPLHVVLSDP